MQVYVAVLNSEFMTLDVRVFKSEGAAKAFKRREEKKGKEYEIFQKKVESMDDYLL
jgi:hypothetical protein